MRQLQRVYRLFNCALGFPPPLDLFQVQYLAEQGNADLNIRDKDGRTAMHLAAEKGCLLVCEYLVKVGADYQLTDNNGITVFDVADRTSGATAAEMRKNVEAAIERGLASAAAAQAEAAAAEQAAREKAEQEQAEGEKEDGKEEEKTATEAPSEVTPEETAA